MKLKLYYNEQLIKTVKISKMQFADIINLILPINVFFKKHLFGSNLASIIVTPYAVKHSKNNIIYLDVKFSEGVNYNA